jgi:hypothetical protein
VRMGLRYARARWGVVILFCVATGIHHGSVHITDHAMQSMAIRASSRTIVRAGPIRSRTAAALRSRPSMRVLRDATYIPRR